MRLTVALASATSLLAPTALVSGQATPSGTKWAVVVGISKYAKLPGGRQLQFADRDAASFAASLAASGIDRNNIRLFTATQATLQAVRSAIGSWLARSSSPSDEVVLFFSGHAMIESEFGEAYLLCYDSDPEDLYSTALSLSDLKQALAERIKARHVLVIADAARRDFFDPEGDAAASLTAAFGRLAGRPGLSAILASGPNQFSREGQRWGGYGVFSKMLTEGMSGKADRDSNGRMTLDELFEFVAVRVPQETSNRQNPWRTTTEFAQFAVAAPGAAPGPVSTAHSTLPEPARTSGLAPSSDTALRAAPSPNSPDSGPPSKERVSASVASAPVRAIPSAQPVTIGKPPLGQEQASTATITNTVDSAPAPPPEGPPDVGAVPAVPIGRSAPMPVDPISASGGAPAPSPLLLQLEASITSGSLIEPKDNNAWDLYQQVRAESGTSSEARRLESLLSEALVKASRDIALGDLRADNISARIDDFRRAGQMLSRARSLPLSDSSIPLLEKLSAALALVGLQFFEEAEKALVGLKDAGLAAVENGLGLTYLGSLDEWRAARAFKRAIEIDPSWATPHYNLAVILKSRNGDESLAEFERAAVLAPSNWAILMALGDEYFAREKWPEAAKAYSGAISARPDHSVLHTKLGHALYSLGRRDEADREYRKARELRGKQE